jgi:hypothetical protein
MQKTERYPNIFLQEKGRAGCYGYALEEVIQIAMAVCRIILAGSLEVLLTGRHFSYLPTRNVVGGRFSHKHGIRAPE